MKKYLLIAFALITINGLSQNTFPPDGNVGIGTANPGHKLEVAGDIGIGTNGTLGSGVSWGCLGCGANSTLQLYDPANGSMLLIHNIHPHIMLSRTQEAKRYGLIIMETLVLVRTIPIINWK